MRNRIRELRKAAKLSQAALADLAGTTQAQIARLETSERRVTVEWLQRIARALYVKPADLLPYGAVVDATPGEAELLANFRAMPDASRSTMIDLSRQLAERRAPGSRKSGGGAGLAERTSRAVPAPRKPYTLHDAPVALLPPPRRD